MSNLSTLPKGDSAWLLRKAIERIMEQVSVLETNIGSSTTGNSANTQIIFNDNGTLRGDAGLTYNAATDTLTAGSATITGDLTVATDAFKVISATKDVCIGTVTPTFNNKLTVVGGGGGDAFITSGNGTRTGYIGTDGTYVIMGGYSNHSLQIHANDIAQMRIAPLGVFEWFDGAGGTRMTLNSTGLGIGASPSYKLEVVAPAGDNIVSIFRSGDATAANNAGGGFRSISSATAASRVAQIWLDADGANFSGGDYFFIQKNGNSGTVEFHQSSNAAMTFLTNSTERARIDSSGNVGIGVTPTNAYSTSRALQIGQGGLIEGRTSDYTTFSLATNAYLSSAGDWTYSSNAKANLYAQSNGAFTWASVAAGTGVATFTPAMTLDASGNLLVGQTTITGANIDSFVYSKSGAYASLSHVSGTGSGTAYIQFLYNNTQIGTITQNGTTGVLYNIVSDYRLKESVKPISGGLARVNALKPSIYNWKSDGSTGEGFLAHELAEVVPFAVSGEKDAMNADGTIKSQGIDMSRIVPILVAAIQELTARVQTLEAR